MKREKSDKIALIVMIVIIVLLLPILAVNLTLIVKGSIHQDTPPDIFGIAPLAVTSGSMDGDQEGSFKKGALIFVKLLDDENKENLKEGEVITYLSADNVYVTHRIITINRGQDGRARSYITQGDANDSTDGAVAVSQVIGKCIGSVNGLGDFAMFMQTPMGILVFVGIPILVYVGYDVTRIVLQNKRAKAEEGHTRELEEKDAEIERLRALVESQAEKDESADEKKPQ